MKNEKHITAISRFLIPLIFLYGIFFSLQLIEGGFLSLIYGVMILSFGLMLYLEINDIDIKLNRIVTYAVMILSLLYLLLVLGAITHYFSL